MSDTKNLANRIPFESIETLHNWSLPSLGDDIQPVPSAQRQARRQQELDDCGVMEDVSETVTVRPLTAEQLQEITEAAEREGREHGYQEGLQQGLQAGEKQGLKIGEQKAYTEFQQQWLDESQRLQRITEQLMVPLASQEAALENLLVEMALKFAEHLLQKALDADPQALYGLVARAVSGLPAGNKNLRIYLNPDDLALLQRASNPLPEAWRLAADGNLSRGGCRVETQNSLVDYSVEKRLSELFEQINAVGEPAEESFVPPADHRPQAGPVPADLSGLGESEPDQQHLHDSGGPQT